MESQRAKVLSLRSQTVPAPPLTRVVRPVWLGADETLPAGSEHEFSDCHMAQMLFLLFFFQLNKTMLSSWPCENEQPAFGPQTPALYSAWRSRPTFPEGGLGKWDMCSGRVGSWAWSPWEHPTGFFIKGHLLRGLAL